MSVNEVIKTNTKDNIAGTALKLFVQKGYHSTSIPDIVDASGLSTGAVYHHFESKEQLAKYIHNRATELFTDKYSTYVRPRTTFRDKIQAFVKMMFEWDDEDPVMVKYLITDRPVEVLNRKNTVCSEEGLKLVGEMVSEGMLSKEICADNYFIALSLISGTIIHFINLKKDGYISGALSEKSAALADHICMALCRN